MVRAPDAPPEDPALISSTHTVAQNSLTLVIRGPDPSLPSAGTAYMWCTDVPAAKTSIHVKK